MMGTSHGDFTKYPRTPHLFGSKGTDDDKQGSQRQEPKGPPSQVENK